MDTEGKTVELKIIKEITYNDEYTKTEFEKIKKNCTQRIRRKDTKKRTKRFFTTK